MLCRDGGVSMFALLICLAAGVRPIVTSSSDQKLRDISAVGPDGAIDIINYCTNPDWEKEGPSVDNGKRR